MREALQEEGTSEFWLWALQLCVMIAKASHLILSTATKNKKHLLCGKQCCGQVGGWLNNVDNYERLARRWLRALRSSVFTGLAGEASVCLKAAQWNIIVKDAKRITSMFLCHCLSPSTCLPAVFCVVTFSQRSPSSRVFPGRRLNHMESPLF